MLAGATQATIASRRNDRERVNSREVALPETENCRVGTCPVRVNQMEQWSPREAA